MLILFHPRVSFLGHKASPTILLSVCKASFLESKALFDSTAPFLHGPQPHSKGQGLDFRAKLFFSGHKPQFWLQTIGHRAPTLDF